MSGPEEVRQVGPDNLSGPEALAGFAVGVVELLNHMISGRLGLLHSAVLVFVYEHEDGAGPRMGHAVLMEDGSEVAGLSSAMDDAKAMLPGIAAQFEAGGKVQ